MSDEYYIYSQDAQEGPYTLQQLKSMWVSGVVTADAHYWQEGLDEWRPLLSLLPEPASCLRRAPPFAPTARQPSLSESLKTSATHYAGFWRRVIAMTIDWLPFAIPAFAVGALLSVMLQGPLPREYQDMINLISFVTWWLYFALMESSRLQASLGKLALRIKVTDLHGRQISFGRATGRHFAKFFSAVILCIGFLMAAFTANKQALHDRIANTLVICP